MTEPLLSQQLESPSGTGRVEPRSHISLTGPATNQRDAYNQLPHSHWQFCAPGRVQNGRMTFTNVVRSRDGGPYPCPCCGFITLPERGGDDICPVCFWEDDRQDDHDVEVVREDRTTH